MPRIEPIPWEELRPEVRRRMEDGMAEGRYSTSLPLQIFAYSTDAFVALDEDYRRRFGKGLLEPRLVELIRIRSAQIGSCDPCMASRKEASVTEEDVACLAGSSGEQQSPRERAAIRFFDLFATDHHAIGDDTYRELAEVFTTAEIVELGLQCAGALGMHRFVHTLDVFGRSEPAIRYRADAVDARIPEEACKGA
jgi:AhpD family alkylhydroperoxidase